MIREGAKRYKMDLTIRPMKNVFIDDEIFPKEGQLKGETNRQKQS